MNTFVNYLLEVSVCWGVFFLFYHFWLTNQTAHQYNRFYLLAASLLGVILPLLEITVGTVPVRAVGSSYILPDPLPASGGYEAAKSTFQWRWDYFFWTVYGLGVLIVTGYYVQQFLSVLRAIRLSYPQTPAKENYRLLHTQGRFPTSSFFRCLLWDNTQKLSATEARQMMAHEVTHIRQKHSYDITYFTLLKIVFWFHPLVYLLGRALVENHEFAADAGALQHPSANRQTYSRLLAKQSMARLPWTVVNHFYKPKTLKRIKMMEKHNNLRWYRYALIVPVVATLFLVFSCQPDTEELEQQAIAESYGDIMAKLKEVDSQRETLVGKYFENPGHFMDEVKKEASKDAGLSSGHRSHYQVRLKVFGDVASNQDYISYKELYSLENSLRKKLRTLPDADGVFAVVENMPEPTGGMQEFYRYIDGNMKFPKKVLAKNNEGKVFVQFVVNEYGELTNFQVLKNTVAGCDEEAIRVLRNAPAWTPGTTDGKPVPVRMIMPITFKLDDGGEYTSNNLLNRSKDRKGRSLGVLGEVVVVGYGAKI